MSISKTEKRERNSAFLRFGFYDLKRNIVRRISPLFKAFKQLDGSRNAYYLQHEHRFGKSNSKLSDLVDLDVSKFGYPISQASEDR
jgi:hypothetical protein